MDVAAWLKNLGLGQYEAAFRDNAIEGDLLPSLTADDLKDLGVTIVGHRRKLLDAIAALGAASEPTLPPAAANPPPTLSSPAVSSRLQARSDASAERRHLTVLFCDLVGSTAISASLDAEDWHNLVSAYLDAASEAVTQMGGRVAKKLGDGLMALFGHPIAQENDAERAVRAALAIQRSLAELNRNNAGSGRPELVARIGVETGAVVVDPDGEIFGDAPNVAARVQALADPGTVLITARVQRQVAGLFVAEDCGAHALKGAPEPTTLFRIARASGAGRRSGQRALTPLVGREDEMAVLLRRWDRARRGEGQFVMIVGEPGLGKSRLIEEFRTRLADTPHTWVEWSSSQLLQNTPFHPIADWGRQRFGGAEAPAERRLADLETSLAQVKFDTAEYIPLLAPLVDIPLPPERALALAPEELRRRQLAAILAWFLAGARAQPVVLAVEDLHWTDPTTLEALRGFAERGALAPLLVVATARPEFRAPWGARSHHGAMTLTPLDRAQVRQMIGEIAERRALSSEVIDGVGERTGGVPLFIEEVTRLLLERTEQSGAQAIPPTLQQSLTARLDRLGPAREVAMIGAVLGRGFSFSLLRAVAEIDRAPLQQALEKLAEADILLVEGLPPEAEYRFKHALIQDAAYENLLKSRRQALHRRAAELLCDGASPEPETIARHFTEAGDNDLAIEWWGRAGDQALRRSAFQEAIAHLGKAIEMADRMAATSAGRSRDATANNQRLKLQASYGEAMGWSKGYAAEETKAAFARAAELAGGTVDFSGRFTALQGQWSAAVTGGELRTARGLAGTVLREAEEAGRAGEARIANWWLGMVAFWRGDFVEARTHHERALAARVPNPDPDAEAARAGDASTWTSSSLAATMWQLGELERARELIDWATRRASALGHIRSIADALFWKSYLEIWRGDPLATLSAAEVLEPLAREHGITQYLNEAELHAGWAQGRIGDPEGGAAQVRRVLAVFVDQGVKVNLGLYNGLLAQLEAETLGADSALARLDEAFRFSEQVEHHCSLPFLHRLRGEVLLKRDAGDVGPAEEAFRTAIAIANEQGARSPGLQAALALARLYQSTGRPADAHGVLAPALEGFAPTPEMSEIAEAQALLATLREFEEVKLALAPHKRRLHLQTAYAQALLWSKGFAAEETRAAFERTGDLATRAELPAERFPALFGQYLSSLLHGDIRAARQIAGRFLQEAEADGRAAEAGVGHRIVGLASTFLGDLASARDNLEAALNTYDRERDSGVREKFALDTGIAARAYLGLASWLAGDLQRANELIEEAVRLGSDSGHLPDLIHALWYKVYIRCLRNDPQGAAADAEDLSRVSRERGVELFVMLADLALSWARGRLGDALSGANELRGSLSHYTSQGNLLWVPTFQGLVAELESRAGEVERASVEIDEGLATAEGGGHAYNEPFLHRLRGDILLKRNPADAAPAEDAYRTAVAIAKKQGARTYELLASLSLAKLYQSTNRHLEAHAILAPALEGFAPMPEMPEIAEAQALMKRLA